MSGMKGIEKRFYIHSVVYHFPLPVLSGKWKDISIYSTKKEKRKRT